MTVRIKVIGLGSAAAPINDDGSPMWVSAWNVILDATPTLTSVPEDALVYADMGEALAAYRAIDPRQPERDDGKPNRPLTAFTVEFEPVEARIRGPVVRNGGP